MANVIALMMRKGGAGKTTLLLLLADALARFGLRVLVVDLDPQGNASIGLGHKVELVETGTTRLGAKPILTPTVPTVVDVIEADEEGVATQAIQIVDWGYDSEEAFHLGGPLFPNKIGTIGLISCYRALETAATAWKPSELERLAKALLIPAETGEPAPNCEWDVVLIDTPPGGSLISVQAAMAAHRALFVTQAEKFGVEAIPETLLLVGDVKDNYRHDELDVLGLVFNEYVDRSITQRTLITQVEENRNQGIAGFGIPVLDGRLPNYTVVGKSQNAEAPLSAYLAANERETAQKVCQNAEVIALQMLKKIEHPETSKIKAAWSKAWPEAMRTPIIRSA
ncbi:ParA family protein [Planomonospora parontospora]|uniref:ParA family protein n=1 Tax=Planomonospora parontospora TaxID=58119 RepID=UPI00167104EB|nr:ParA family protein [Planomonospora parontospora]